mmetsp:Transcript_24107/g.75578  ORF Transcript_24107/g.75578 Transcript_24107/m.75578 type:complete len:335 (-) Transcript_24107:1750-2754(-)
MGSQHSSLMRCATRELCMFCAESFAPSSAAWRSPALLSSSQSAWSMMNSVRFIFSSSGAASLRRRHSSNLACRAVTFSRILAWSAACLEPSLSAARALATSMTVGSSATASRSRSSSVAVAGTGERMGPEAAKLRSSTVPTNTAPSHPALHTRPMAPSPTEVTPPTFMSWNTWSAGGAAEERCPGESTGRAATDPSRDPDTATLPHCETASAWPGLPCAGTSPSGLASLPTYSRPTLPPVHPAPSPGSAYIFMPRSAPSATSPVPAGCAQMAVSGTSALSRRATTSRAASSRSAAVDAPGRGASMRTTSPVESERRSASSSCHAIASTWGWSAR